MTPATDPQVTTRSVTRGLTIEEETGQEHRWRLGFRDDEFFAEAQSESLWAVIRAVWKAYRARRAELAAKADE